MDQPLILNSYSLLGQVLDFKIQIADLLHFFIFFNPYNTGIKFLGDGGCYFRAQALFAIGGLQYVLGRWRVLSLWPEHDQNHGRGFDDDNYR